MPKAMRPVQASGDRADEPVDGPRQPPGPEPIPPVQEVVSGHGLQLESRQRVLVALIVTVESQRGPELPVGLLGRIRATMTLQVRQIGFQRSDDAATLYGANRRALKLSKPFLCSRLRLVELEGFAQ